MVPHTCDPSTPEGEAGGRGIQDQSWLHSKFKANLGYKIPWLKTRKQNRTKTKQKRLEKQSNFLGDLSWDWAVA